MSATTEGIGSFEAKREEERLWRRFGAGRDPADRERLVELYMPLARRMAARYSGVSEPYEDLLQVASLGLLNAVDRFDASRGIPFAGFAKPTILGELKRYFRDKVWTVRVPRSIHDRMAQVEKATEKLTLDLRRPPSTQELAAETGIPVDDLLEVLEARNNRRPISLDAPPTGEDPDESFGGRVGRASRRQLRSGRGSPDRDGRPAEPRRSRARDPADAIRRGTAAVGDRASDRLLADACLTPLATDAEVAR
jgi:RNA polymerase sigma factor (sigma-70 family)